MNNGKRVKVDGIEFNSIKEAADHFGVKLSMLYSRLYRGYTLEEALKMKKLKRTDAIKVDGKEFKNMVEACEYYGVNHSIGLSRLSRGWSIEEALGLVERNVRAIVVGGKEFKNMREACKYYNVSYSRVTRRIERGWDVDEAFGLKEGSLRGSDKRKVEIDGIVFRDCVRACEYYGVNYRTFIARRSRGCSVKESLGLEGNVRGVRNHKVVVEGRVFDSMREASKYYGVGYTTFVSRINRGMSPEEALGLKK